MGVVRDLKFDGIEFNSEWLEGVQLQFHQYMGAMMHAIDQEETWMGASGRDFCGCEWCISREILAFLIPRLTRGVNTGMIATVQEGA